jgi:hypothetical protein
MKQFLFSSFSFILVAAFVSSCKTNIAPPTPSKGSVDPTRYVAIGSSMTAGYADGALSYQAQQNSFPNLIALQLKQIGGGNFNQPLVNSSSIGVSATGGAPFKMGYATDCMNVTSLSPVPVAASGDVSIFTTNVYSGTAFNNMGVPGVKVITMATHGYGNQLNGAGHYNPFFYRMAMNPLTSSVLSDATGQNPTFFTALIGMDDVLSFAMAGAASDSITSTANFTAALNVIINAMTANGAKGAIGNIPDVLSMPYFTTIPYNGLALDSSNNALLNLVYNTRNIYFHQGNNPFVIIDPSAPYGVRLMKSDEYLLLDVPLDSVKCHGLGSYYKGIPNQYVITETEAANIEAAITSYNAIIKSVAQAKGLAFVDVNAFFKSIQTGVTYNGVAMSALFVKGGVYSLDGIDLNPIGQATLANQFITAINNTYGSTIPQLNETAYPGVIFP